MACVCVQHIPAMPVSLPLLRFERVTTGDLPVAAIRPRHHHPPHRKERGKEGRTTLCNYVVSLLPLTRRGTDHFISVLSREPARPNQTIDKWDRKKIKGRGGGREEEEQHP